MDACNDSSVAMEKPVTDSVAKVTVATKVIATKLFAMRTVHTENTNNSTDPYIKVEDPAKIQNGCNGHSHDVNGVENGVTTNGVCISEQSMQYEKVNGTHGEDPQNVHVQLGTLRNGYGRDEDFELRAKICHKSVIPRYRNISRNGDVRNVNDSNSDYMMSYGVRGQAGNDPPRSRRRSASCDRYGNITGLSHEPVVSGRRSSVQGTYEDRRTCDGATMDNANRRRNSLGTTDYTSQMEDAQKSSSSGGSYEMSQNRIIRPRSASSSRAEYSDVTTARNGHSSATYSGDVNSRNDPSMDVVSDCTSGRSTRTRSASLSRAGFDSNSCGDNSGYKSERLARPQSAGSNRTNTQTSGHDITRRTNRRRYQSRRIYDDLTADDDTMSDFGTFDDAKTPKTDVQYPLLWNTTSHADRTEYKDIGWKLYNDKFKTAPDSTWKFGSKRRNYDDFNKQLGNSSVDRTRSSDKSRIGRSMSVDRGRSAYEDTGVDEDPVKISTEELDCCPHHGECGREDCHRMVSMFKNFREAFDGYKHKINQDGSLCDFSVNSVAPEDCGEIECRAYNKAGNASSSARLSIHVPPKLKVSANILEGMTFSESQPMRIRIPMLGRPLPRVIWSKDGDILENSERHEISVEDSTALMVICQPSKADTGVYKIESCNQFGRDQASFNVIILGRPDPPTSAPMLRDITSDSLRLDWETSICNGSDIITSYKVEKRMGTDEEWTKCGSTHLTNLKLYRLKEHVEYRFRVCVENIHGVSDSGPPSDPVILKQPTLDIDYDKFVLPPIKYQKVNLEQLKLDVDSKYIICEEIGRGKYGVIHRAIERSTSRNWAAKFYQYGNSERVMVRQELEIMNELHHPRLLYLHDVFDCQGEISMVFELLSGGDILERISAPESDLTEEDVISFIRQISQALAHLHKNNIVHLDIKAENALFVTSGSREVKLIDFGLCQRVELARKVRVSFSSADYCAPEIVNFEPISFASDMWSLGIMAHILLVGISPFLGCKPRETFLSISHAHSPDLHTPHWQYISHYAKNWIQSLLVKDKSQRMTINQALAHPWLNGEAEANISRISLPTDNHRVLVKSQKWRTKYPCCLSIGRLAHQSPVFTKISRHAAFERELTMDMPDREPQVVIELSGTESYEGTTGRFKCKFQGKPEPTVKWYHEGGEIKPCAKYDFWYKNGLCMMNVNDVSLDDAGQYQCVATNSVSMCTTVGELHVHELGWRRRSIDNGKINLTSRRRSLSFERDSWSVERGRRRSLSIEHTSGSSSRSGSVSSSHTWTNDSSGYGTNTFFNTVDANIPPQFTLALLDQTLPLGEQCTMVVLATCFPDPELTWYHEHERIRPSDKYVMEGERGFQRLTLQYIDASDAGSWRCAALNSYGQAMTTCRLNVLERVPPGATVPRLVPQLIKAVALEGGTARLEWKVSGTPQPQLQWYKDRHLIPGSDHYHMRYDEMNNSHALFISNTLHEDSGYYGCHATNTAGTAFMETQLVVEGLDYDSIYSQRSAGSAPSEQESTITKSSLVSSRKKRLDASPQFMSKLRPKRCSEGQTIRMNCSVQGLPLPDVTWFKGNRIIEDGGKYRISNNYGLLSLEITNVNRDDQGLYTVKAVNVEGEIACSAPIEVLEVAPDQEKLGLTTKPYFLVDMQNVWGEVGQKAVFEAQATGKPMPSFRWQKDNINIMEDDKFKVFSDERGNTKLIIRNVAMNDQGLYFCLAENREGKQKTAASLRVVDKGQLIDGERPAAIRRRSLSREATPVFDTFAAPGRGTKPYFLQLPPSEMTAISGDPLMMRCVIDGDPKPVVKWYKGVRELNYTNRHRVLVEGDQHIMQIRAVLQTDPGEYSIEAENPLGKVKTNVWLKVTPRPEGEDEDFDATRRTLEFPDFDEYELDVTREQGKMAPKFVKRLPLEKEIQEGESLQIGCKIEDVHLPEYIVGVELKVKTKEGVAAEDEAVPVTEATTEEAVADVKATVEAIAESVAETVVMTAVAEAVAAAPEKGCAPDLSVPLKNKTVKVGGVVKLTVVVKDAKPSATVRWFKDGNDVTEDDHYEIYAEEDSYNLELIDVEASDSGAYSVTASNDMGSASSDCTITVQEITVEAESVEVASEVAVEVAAEASIEVVAEESVDVPVSPVEVVVTPAEDEVEDEAAEATITVALDEEVKAEVTAEAENEAAEATITVALDEEVKAEVVAEAETEAVVSVEVVEETTEAVMTVEAVESAVSVETTEEAAEATIEVTAEATEVDSAEITVEIPAAEPVAEQVAVEEAPTAETPAPEPATVEDTPKEVTEDSTKDEKKKKKKKKDKESEESAVEEKVTEEEKPKEEKKKKKKKEEKSEEEPATEDSGKEEKKKKKKKKESEEEASTTGAEDVPKEEKKKKKKKDKVEEPSEDDVVKEDAAKDKKKKKKKDKEESADSTAEKSPDESSKEEKKKKKKKDKKSDEEQVEVKEEVAMETAAVVESSQSVMVEESEESFTVSQEAVVEMSMDTSMVDEVGAGDAVMEVEAAEETVTLQMSVDESQEVAVAADESETLTLQMNVTESQEAETVVIADESETMTLQVTATEDESAAEAEISLTADVSGEAEEESASEVEETVTFETSSTVESSMVVMEQSSEVTLNMSSMEQTVDVEGDTVTMETVQLSQTISDNTTQDFDEEVDAAITLVADSSQIEIEAEAAQTIEMEAEAEQTIEMEAEAEQTIEMTTETIVMSSEVHEESGDSGEESEADSEEEESAEEESDAEMADESETGKGDAVPVGDSSIERTVTLGGTEGETGTTRTQTKTMTTSGDGETTVEVRTVTQTRIVEMVEGDVEDAEADFTIEAGSPPQLQTPLRGCVVNEGETARLQCQISCDVELEISWTKDGDNLSDSDRLNLSFEGDGVYALTISDAQKSDEGDYTIIASSSGGTIQLTANIIVLKESQDSEEEESEEEESEGEEEKKEGEDEGSEEGEEEGSEEESQEETGDSEEEEEEEEEEHSEEIITEKLSEDENSSENKSYSFGGLFTQAVKIGEYLLRDYIM